MKPKPACDRFTLLGDPVNSVMNDAEHGVALSVVIPAYDERSRLPHFLAGTRRYLDTNFADGYEVIVVDDGSRDGTLDFLESLSADWPRLAVLRHLENVGKGAAVKTGMACARGELWLFADADGATPISEEATLRAAIVRGADAAIGSRTLPCERTPRLRTVTRRFAGWLFTQVIRVLFRLPVRDTQCGFKMFSRAAGQRVFAALKEPGFAFDLELLALARLEGYRVAEVPVAWCEMPGSKVRFIRDAPRMLKSLIAIRRRLRSACVVARNAGLPDAVMTAPGVVAK